MKRVLVWIMIICTMFLCTACKSEEATVVEQKISSIGSVTKENYTLIQETRVAYNNLSEEDKEDISNYSLLVDAELDYNTIFAEKVDQLIQNIGPINDDSKAAIDLARVEYEKLTKEQKCIVNHFGDLIVAEKEQASYSVNRAIEVLKALSESSSDTEEAIKLAEKVCGELTDKQKVLVTNQVGDIDELIRNAKVKSVEQLIERIKYTKGEPNANDLKIMIEALTVYQELSEEVLTQVTNNEKIEKAIQGYTSYKKKKKKTDKLLIRENYISQCETIALDNLMLYPKSYKGQKVSMEINIVEIEEGILILSDSIVAIVTGTENALEIRDHRAMKEPIISEGDTFTVYGTFEGTKKIDEPDEESALFGLNFLEKDNGKCKIPVIKFVYASNDNFGVIATGNPNAIDGEEDKELIELENQLDKLIDQIQ